MAAMTFPSWQIDPYQRTDFIDSHPNNVRFEQVVKTLQRDYNAKLEHTTIQKYNIPGGVADREYFSTQTLTHVNGVNMRLSDEDFKLLVADIAYGRDAIQDQSRFFAERHKEHLEKELRKANPGLDQAYQAYLVLLELYKEHGK